MDTTIGTSDKEVAGKVISEEVQAAAERLLDNHRRYEDSDTDADGNRVEFEACEIDSDDDWPCDTARVAQAIIDLVGVR